MSEFVIQLVKSKKGAQAVGVLLMGLGVFLVISLISHSALDYPNSSRLVAESFNWGGKSALTCLMASLQSWDSPPMSGPC